MSKKSTAKKAAKNAKPPKVKDVAKKVGNPSTYTQKKANEICERLAKGESLNKICAEKNNPTANTFHRWLRENEDLQRKYARAREAQANFYADEIVEIADTSTSENVNVARLKIDSRKWIACKLHPKAYGEKLDVTTRDETPTITREWMIETMRKSPDFLAEVESMVAEAKKKA